MATAKPTVIFNHNLGLADVALGIGQDSSVREFVPVEFRVGRHYNKAGESVGALKLFLWATQTKGRRMTLGEFLVLFGEYWTETECGKSPPSKKKHPNLHELWRLWKRNPDTLVSDVFKVSGYPFKMKEVAVI
jgi:hypothetical protein